MKMRMKTPKKWRRTTHANTASIVHSMVVRQIRSLLCKPVGWTAPLSIPGSSTMAGTSPQLSNYQSLTSQTIMYSNEA